MARMWLADPEQARARAAELDNDPSHRIRRQRRPPEGGKRLLEVTPLSTLETVLFLRGVDLFAQVPDDLLVAVSHETDEVFFQPGERLVTQGDTGQCLYIIVSGDVDAEVEGVGKVASIGPGQVLGEMAILSDSRRTASCMATTPVTALQLDREPFLEILQDRGEIALAVVRALVTRLVAKEDTIKAIKAEQTNSAAEEER